MTGEATASVPSAAVAARAAMQTRASSETPGETSPPPTAPAVMTEAEGEDSAAIAVTGGEGVAPDAERPAELPEGSRSDDESHVGLEDRANAEDRGGPKAFDVDAAPAPRANVLRQESNGESRGGVPPRAAEADGYRQRADRLMERAQRQWEAGHREESLRLAQLAARLELQQKVVYRSDEESPTQFIERLRGLPEGASLTLTAPTRAGESETLPPLPPVASEAHAGRPAGEPGRGEPVSGQLGSGQSSTGEVVAGNPTGGAETSPTTGSDPVAAGQQRLDALVSGHRFHRAAHRQPDPAEEVTVPSSAALAEFERLARVEAGGPGSAEGVAVAVEAPAPPASEAVESGELRDLPLELGGPIQTTVGGATWLSPRVRWWLTWNRLSFLGLGIGLACLLVLWVWRELERWHHRGLSRAGFTS